MIGIRNITVVGRNISPVSNACFSANLAHAVFFYRVVVTINIFTIHEVNGVYVTGVVALHGRSATASPCTSSRVYTILGISGQF